MNLAGTFSLKKIIRLLPWLVVVAALLQAAFLRQAEVLAWPHMGHEFGPADSDIWLRLTQVRQFINGGDFFDHTVRNTNAPEGGVSIHWTRPMDFLLSLFYFLTPAGISQTQRLLLAAAWLPPVLGVLAFAALVAAVRRRFDNRHAIWLLLLLLAVSPFPSYFPPGECDHHGLLALLWCGVIWLMMKPMSPRAAAGAGALLGAMIWISMEGLMLYGVVGLILGLFALKRWDDMRTLFYVAAAAAVVCTLGLFIEVPRDHILTFVKFDTLSIVYVTLLWLVAAITFILSTLGKVVRRSFPGRVLACGLGVMLVLGVEVMLFPRVIFGPLADVHPFITHEFFARVMESKPLLKQPFVMILEHLWQAILAALLLAATWSKNMREARQRQVVTLSLMLAGALAMTLSQGRWTYYLQPPALVAIATILPVWATVARRGMRRIERRYRPYLALFLAGAIMAAAGAPFDYTPDRDLWNCQAQMRFMIQSQQLTYLMGQSDRILYAPAEVGGDVLFFTPYRIIAGEYHREGQGLQDLAAIEESTTASTALKVLTDHKVDHMLVCPDFAPKTSWLRTLSAKNHPEWLLPVPGGRKFMHIPGPRPMLFLIYQRPAPKDGAPY